MTGYLFGWKLIWIYFYLIIGWQKLGGMPTNSITDDYNYFDTMDIDLDDTLNEKIEKTDFYRSENLADNPFRTETRVENTNNNTLVPRSINNLLFGKLNKEDDSEYKKLLSLLVEKSASVTIAKRKKNSELKSVKDNSGRKYTMRPTTDKQPLTTFWPRVGLRHKERPMPQTDDYNYFDDLDIDFLNSKNKYIGDNDMLESPLISSTTIKPILRTTLRTKPVSPILRKTTTPLWQLQIPTIRILTQHFPKSKSHRTTTSSPLSMILVSPLLSKTSHYKFNTESNNILPMDTESYIRTEIKRPIGQSNGIEYYETIADVLPKTKEIESLHNKTSNRLLVGKKRPPSIKKNKKIYGNYNKPVTSGKYSNKDKMNINKILIGNKMKSRINNNNSIKKLKTNSSEIATEFQMGVKKNGTIKFDEWNRGHHYSLHEDDDDDRSLNEQEVRVKEHVIKTRYKGMKDIAKFRAHKERLKYKGHYENLGQIANTEANYERTTIATMKKRPKPLTTGMTTLSTLEGIYGCEKVLSYTAPPTSKKEFTTSLVIHIQEATTSKPSKQLILTTLSAKPAAKTTELLDDFKPYHVFTTEIPQMMENTEPCVQSHVITTEDIPCNDDVFTTENQPMTEETESCVHDAVTTEVTFCKDQSFTTEHTPMTEKSELCVENVIKTESTPMMEKTEQCEHNVVTTEDTSAEDHGCMTENPPMTEKTEHCEHNGVVTEDTYYKEHSFTTEHPKVTAKTEHCAHNAGETEGTYYKEHSFTTEHPKVTEKTEICIHHMATTEETTCKEHSSTTENPPITEQHLTEHCPHSEMPITSEQTISTTTAKPEGSCKLVGQKKIFQDTATNSQYPEDKVVENLKIVFKSMRHHIMNMLSDVNKFESDIITPDKKLKTFKDIEKESSNKLLNECRQPGKFSISKTKMVMPESLMALLRSNKKKIDDFELMLESGAENRSEMSLPIPLILENEENLTYPTDGRLTVH